MILHPFVDDRCLAALDVGIVSPAAAVDVGDYCVATSATEADGNYGCLCAISLCLPFAESENGENSGSG